MDDSTVTGRGAQLACDGCGGMQDIEQLHFITDYGHECRYCTPCRAEYVDFVRATTAQEKVLQRQLDEWIIWARGRMTLTVTPWDLAKSRPEIQQQARDAGLTLA